MNKRIKLILMLSILLGLPTIIQAQGGDRTNNEFVAIQFPSAGEGEVSEAMDYVVYLTSRGILLDDKTACQVGFTGV